MVNQETVNAEHREDIEEGKDAVPDPLVDVEALLGQIKSIRGDEVEGVAVLSFRALQLYRIAILQAELTKKQIDIMSQKSDGRGKEGKIVDGLLQNYGELERYVF
jgi:hypothetical protein